VAGAGEAGWADPLALDRETMRTLGYRTVDMLVDILTDPDAVPLRRARAVETSALLAGPEPSAGAPFEELLEALERDVLSFRSRGDHPGFFAFIPFNSTWPGALGDFVASACNVYAGSWMESAGPSQVELEVLGWFKSWLGYPEDAAGILVSGGSAANLTALACAREAAVGFMSPDVVAYMSDQAHSSLARGARVLGFRREQVRVLPSDRNFRLPPEALATALDADLAAGRRPILVAATAGTTNTGTVDPLGELAAVCRERGVWLHVDAAYGGFAVLAERGRAQLTGIELADSVTLDPHKWLYQPYECGCLLVREGRVLRRAFEIIPDYLRDSAAHEGEVNFADLGIQLTRSARALKLWLSLRYFGIDAFRRAIERSLALAAHARDIVERSETLELLAPPSLGIVCFRRRFPGAGEAEHEHLNAGLVAALEQSGIALVSSTRLHGRYAIRMCVMNHSSDVEHVEAALAFLEHTVVAVAKTSVVDTSRDPDVREVAVSAALADAPLFRSLSGAQAHAVAALATSRTALPGETVIEKWDSSRDFFVIVEGSAAVLAGVETMAELGPGDFFGELAALDWGAGFGYPRLATVVATTPLRLLVFADGALERVLRAAPSLEPVIREAVRTRVRRE
jgi:aromatic-L-amino-acid/L-tryptophan decarboxylase